MHKREAFGADRQCQTQDYGQFRQRAIIWVLRAINRFNERLRAERARDCRVALARARVAAAASAAATAAAAIVATIAAANNEVAAPAAKRLRSADTVAEK